MELLGNVWYLDEFDYKILGFLKSSMIKIALLVRWVFIESFSIWRSYRF